MKSEAIKGHQGSVPEKSSSPTMPKMRKRKPASPMTHPSWGIAAKIEAMSTGIPGTKRRERNLMREAILCHQRPSERQSEAIRRAEGT